jgi:hypothetical protein
MKEYKKCIYVHSEHTLIAHGTIVYPIIQESWACYRFAKRCDELAFYHEHPHFRCPHLGLTMNTEDIEI